MKRCRLCAAVTISVCAVALAAMAEPAAAQTPQTPTSQPQAQAGRAAVQTPRITAPLNPKSDRTVTATRVTKPIKVDGRFDDEAYQLVMPYGDFVQQDPQEGEPASEKTDFWI